VQSRQSTTVFQHAYQQLNAQQKLAVDTIDGPVMVIAGPGTGKTQVLAMRIANILLKTDTNPSAILALTFTESAAKNMRERLLQLIGSTAYSVHVQTFHAFCDEVIRACPEYFPVRQESEVLSDLERYEILEKLLTKNALTALKTMNSPFHFIKPVMKAISDLKREGVSEVQFAELMEKQSEELEAEKDDLKKMELSRRQKNLAKQQELSLLYLQYQKELRERRRYDYDDMITFVAEAFKSEESLLLEYQEKLTYFLVDEYQDTNAAQNRVVDLLASYWGEQANLFVVGDPHQSIYRFQGASLENTLNFVNRYPTATFIALEQGYRCPQVLYDSASEVIAHNQTTLRPQEVHSVETELQSGAQQIAAQQFVAEQVNKGLTQPLQSVQKKQNNKEHLHSKQEKREEESKIQIYAAPSAPLETIFLAETISDLLARGTPPNEIAVLYRNNTDAQEIRTALEKWQVPYVIDGGNDVLKSEEMQQLLTLCTVIADLRTAKEGHELFEVMNYSWLHLSHYLVMKIARAAGTSKMSIYDRINKGYADFCRLPFCEDVTALEFVAIENFIAQLMSWGQQDAEVTFPEWLEILINESGYLDWILTHPNKVILLHQLNALFREVKNLAIQDHRINLARFLEIIDTMRVHGIGIAVEETNVTNQAVTLSTVHKAKGREWEYVFLLQCIDGKWGNARQVNLLPLPTGILQHQPQEKESNDDDRRLFYVAMTRAKKQFTISYPESFVIGNSSKLTMGSVFMTEISDAHKQYIQNPPSQQSAETHLARLVTVAPAQLANEQEKKWLQKIAADFPLSVTALNTYLRSPQEFLENFLLKVPRATPAYFAFGTAVHYALEQYYTTFS
jgi:DNA helicase-2/ATP-dependent DNA helicase PcrA